MSLSAKKLSLLIALFLAAPDLNSFRQWREVKSFLESVGSWLPSVQNNPHGTSLVKLWVRMCLSLQGTRVWSLVQEDSTCLRTTKPRSCNYWAHVLQLLKPSNLEPVLYNKRSHRNEKPACCNKNWHLLMTTRENPCKAIKTHCSQKERNKFMRKNPTWQSGRPILLPFTPFTLKYLTMYFLKIDSLIHNRSIVTNIKKFSICTRLLSNPYASFINCCCNVLCRYFSGSQCALTCQVFLVSVNWSASSVFILPFDVDFFEMVSYFVECLSIEACLLFPDD